MKTNKVETYETYQTSEHGYTQTHIVIRTMYAEDTVKMFEGTVDNKAGYGTQEAAQQQGRRYQAMLEQGCKVHYDSCYTGTHIHMRWQHYKDEQGTPNLYCEVKFDNLGGSFIEIDKAMGFLRKLGKRIQKAQGTLNRPVSEHDFTSPEVVLVELSKMKKLVKVTRNKEFVTWLPV